MTAARHFLVAGLFQGVWFRYSEKAEVERLRLRGWEWNLEDGGGKYRRKNRYGSIYWLPLTYHLVLFFGLLPFNR